eukprot:4805088-Pyramimonas_sp.AAC.1
MQVIRFVVQPVFGRPTGLWVTCAVRATQKRDVWSRNAPARADVRTVNEQMDMPKEFSGDPPAGGPPVRCALRRGWVLSRNASLRVDAHNVMQLPFFASHFSGDPPAGGSHVRCHSGR